jgi:predicted regulator of Ras-like GTPase activity (Roadblock/LC7/MglB family)
MANDDIRALSEALAADPSSIAFLPLAEALRKRGDVELAWRIATRGVERHAQRPDAHDLVARIALDRGDTARARAEWETVLTLLPANPGAQKGLGFLFFQQGDLAEAQRYLAAAAQAAPDDQSLTTALAMVRAAAADAEHAAVDRATPGGQGALAALPVPPFAPAPADSRTLFAEVLGHEPQTALLIDAEGYVVAGEYVTDDGIDLGADLGAQLSGVSDEASRAMRHLGMGAWQQIVFESEAASVAMAPSGDGVLLVAASRSVPLGYVRRLLERSLDRARRWLASGT